jgi:ribosomal protein L11 methyltransferase
MLLKYVDNKSTVLDVGCGSGILSIASAKLGAVVDGCDTDLVSVENAEKNALLNGVSYRHLWKGSVNTAICCYDVVIANIVADVLVVLSKDLKAVLKQEGVLILSGILDKYEKKVLAHYADCSLVERISDGEWVSLVLQKKE